MSHISVLPYTLPLGRTVPPLDRLVSSPLESRVLRSLLPPVRGSTASSVPLAPGSSLKTGLSSSSSGILSRLSSEILDRACSFFRRPGGREEKHQHLVIELDVFTGALRTNYMEVSITIFTCQAYYSNKPDLSLTIL